MAKDRSAPAGGTDKGGGQVKTAQPFSDNAGDEPYNGRGGAPKPRPDQVDDPAATEESEKTTQRQE